MGTERKAPVAATNSTKNALFDAIDGPDSPQGSNQKFPSMENLGLFDSFESNDSHGSSGNVPRPPSPEFGSGQRTTNPHSSAAVQSMGNSTSNPNINIFDQPPAEDDFFASFSSSPTLQPTKSVN